MDDVGNITTSKNHEDLVHNLKVTSAQLSEHDASMGVTLNADKLAHLAWSGGKGSAEFFNHAYSEDFYGKASLHTRYLGPHLHFAGSVTPELDGRVAAATKIWFSYGKIWSSATDIKMRSLVFRSVIQMTLLSALP